MAVDKPQNVCILPPLLRPIPTGPKPWILWSERSGGGFLRCSPSRGSTWLGSEGAASPELRPNDTLPHLAVSLHTLDQSSWSFCQDHSSWPDTGSKHCYATRSNVGFRTGGIGPHLTLEWLPKHLKFIQCIDLSTSLLKQNCRLLEPSCSSPESSEWCTF